MSLSLGPAIHGNYHGYYAKRPFVQDPRLSLIPSHIFKGSRVLDIGCNEGVVTCEIAQAKEAKKVIGVDIDDSLTRMAWKRRRTVWSQQGPLERNEPTEATEGTTAAPSTSTLKRKRSQDQEAKTNTSTDDFQPIPDYFPESCEHMFGPLPISAAASNFEDDVFPHNVIFETADWVNSEIIEDREGYGVVVAFSVSKWIHLNGGDIGLETFFRRVISVLKPGGHFILEPQEWETYAKAKRASTKLKENAKNLKIRPEDFPKILQKFGFKPPQHLGKTGAGGFHRSVDLYQKPHLPIDI